MFQYAAEVYTFRESLKNVFNGLNLSLKANFLVAPPLGKKIVGRL
jgi:hypothetical protein